MPVRKTMAQKLRDAQKKNSTLKSENEKLNDLLQDCNKLMREIKTALFDDYYSDEDPVAEIKRLTEEKVAKKISRNSLIGSLQDENTKLWDMVKMQADDPRIKAQARQIDAHSHQIENMPPEEYRHRRQEFRSDMMPFNG